MERNFSSVFFPGACFLLSLSWLGGFTTFLGVMMFASLALTNVSIGRAFAAWFGIAVLSAVFQVFGTAILAMAQQHDLIGAIADYLVQIVKVPLGSLITLGLGAYFGKRERETASARPQSF